MLSNLAKIAELENKEQRFELRFTNYQYFTWNIFLITIVLNSVMLSYICYHLYIFPVKEKNENTSIHQNKMFLYILNKSNFLHRLDFLIYLASLTSHSEEDEALKTWTNPWETYESRVPRQTSELAANGAFAVSA